MTGGHSIWGVITFRDTGHPQVQGKPSRVRYRDPPPFTGKPDKFKEWLFAVEEALETKQPADPAVYVASFLDGSARRWLMALWGQDGRSATARHLKKKLRDAFEEKHEEERRRLLVVQAR